MPEPRLMAVITALILMAGSAPARADYEIDQLQQIEQFILRKDCASLWQYLVSNPSIMAGDDALARELRVFVSATERGQLNCFAARTPPPVVAPPPVMAFAVKPIEPY